VLRLVNKNRSVYRNKNYKFEITPELERLAQEAEAILKSRIGARKDIIEKYNTNIKTKGPLSMIRWIVDNPGRQWTSSLNPTPIHPRDYYNHNLYIPHTVGLDSKIESCIRLCCKHTRLINRDAVNIILSKLCWSIANDMLSF
jgi:hypothetical protein